MAALQRGDDAAARSTPLRSYAIKAKLRRMRARRGRGGGAAYSFDVRNGAASSDCKRSSIGHSVTISSPIAIRTRYVPAFGSIIFRGVTLANWVPMPGRSAFHVV